MENPILDPSTIIASQPELSPQRGVVKLLSTGTLDGNVWDAVFRLEFDFCCFTLLYFYIFV